MRTKRNIAYLFTGDHHLPSFVMAGYIHLNYKIQQKQSSPFENTKWIVSGCFSRVQSSRSESVRVGRPPHGFFSFESCCTPLARYSSLVATDSFNNITIKGPRQNNIGIRFRIFIIPHFFINTYTIYCWLCFFPFFEFECDGLKSSSLLRNVRIVWCLPLSPFFFHLLLPMQFRELH